MLWVRCDHDGCRDDGAEVTGLPHPSEGTSAIASVRLPAGWAKVGDGYYCPSHATQHREAERIPADVRERAIRQREQDLERGAAIMACDPARKPLPANLHLARARSRLHDSAVLTQRSLEAGGGAALARLRDAVEQMGRGLDEMLDYLEEQRG